MDGQMGIEQMESARGKQLGRVPFGGTLGPYLGFLPF